MSKGKYKVIPDPVHGYRRLDPVPDETEITGFYQSKYYDLIRKGQRAPEICRLMSGGEKAAAEASWLRSTLYADILAVLEQHKNPGHHQRLIDIGCGTGEFISFMNESGWETTGLELSEQAAAIAKDKGLKVYDISVEEFCLRYPQQLSAFTVVTLVNVLEHVPNPVEFLGLTKKLLIDGGIIVIRVPNDFNELQLSAQLHLQKEPWWVAIPDHINYFDFQSLQVLLENLGFEVICAQGDFPMEFFLLMGDDYVGNSDVGGECHQKRVRFEMAVSGELRRRMYKALAEVGVGRDCLVFGRLRST